MVVQFIKFRSELTEAEVRRVIESRAADFEALPGLLQKYYMKEPATGEFAGVYLWESEEAMRAFRESELARGIPGAYRVVGAPRVEIFEVVRTLRPTAAPAGG